MEIEIPAAEVNATGGNGGGFASNADEHCEGMNPLHHHPMGGEMSRNDGNFVQIDSFNDVIYAVDGNKGLIFISSSEDVDSNLVDLNQVDLPAGSNQLLGHHDFQHIDWVRDSSASLMHGSVICPTKSGLDSMIPETGCSPPKIIATARSKRPSADSHKRKREYDANAPKAPMSGYQLYAKERREQLRRQNSGLKFADLVKICGSEWTNLDGDMKQKYLDQAMKDRDRFNKELEEYYKSAKYREFVEKKKSPTIAGCDILSDLQIQTESEDLLNDDEDSLYCKVCNIYFTSHHNKREHQFGRNHMTKLEELRSCKDCEPHVSDLILINDPPPPPPLSPSDVDGFITSFTEKNLDRELEIRCLRNSLQSLQEKSHGMQERWTKLQEEQKSVGEDLSNLKQVFTVLSNQIESLRLVLALFSDSSSSHDPL